MPCSVHVLFRLRPLILQQKKNGNEKNNNCLCRNESAPLHGVLEMCRKVPEESNRQNRFLRAQGFLGHRHVIFENADACIGCNKCIKTCPQGVFFKPDASVSCTMNMGMAFRIERLLPLAFVASAVTGIGLHIAGHGTSHETWHNWGVAHVVASFIWLLSVMAHVRRHKHWYKTLVSKRVTCKRLITFFLSIAFLIVAVTGILLVAYVDRK